MLGWLAFGASLVFDSDLILLAWTVAATGVILEGVVTLLNLDAAGDKYADSQDRWRRLLRQQPLNADERRRYIRVLGFGWVTLGLIFLSIGLISLLR